MCALVPSAALASDDPTAVPRVHGEIQIGFRVLIARGFDGADDFAVAHDFHGGVAVPIGHTLDILSELLEHFTENPLAESSV